MVNMDIYIYIEMINDDGILIMESYTIHFLNFVFGTQWPKNPIGRSSTMSIIPKRDTQSDSTVVSWRICNIFPCTIAIISNGETSFFNFYHAYIELVVYYCTCSTIYYGYIELNKMSLDDFRQQTSLHSSFSHDFP